jgi:hypothetical protein
VHGARNQGFKAELRCESTADQTFKRHTHAYLSVPPRMHRSILVHLQHLQLAQVQRILVSALVISASCVQHVACKACASPHSFTFPAYNNLHTFHIALLSRLPSIAQQLQPTMQLAAAVVYRRFITGE